MVGGLGSVCSAQLKLELMPVSVWDDPDYSFVGGGLEANGQSRKMNYNV